MDWHHIGAVVSDVYSRNGPHWCSLTPTSIILLDDALGEGTEAVSYWLSMADVP